MTIAPVKKWLLVRQFEPNWGKAISLAPSNFAPQYAKVVVGEDYKKDSVVLFPGHAAVVRPSPYDPALLLVQVEDVIATVDFSGKE